LARAYLLNLGALNPNAFRVSFYYFNYDAAGIAHLFTYTCAFTQGGFKALSLFFPLDTAEITHLFVTCMRACAKGVKETLILPTGYCRNYTPICHLHACLCKRRQRDTYSSHWILQKLHTCLSLACVLVQEEASAKRSASLAAYTDLKNRLLTMNLLLLIVGSGVTALLSQGDKDTVLTFAAGGGAGAACGMG
jgi:hypothetical protein